MPEASSVASFRRVTPGIVAAARLAMANDVPDTSKSEIALLLKKAAPILGIDGTTYHVMDILLGLSRSDDWSGAGRPIVAISNAKLAEYTMRSERTVIRAIRRLVEAGIAAYRDSPTGRRFVYRNDAGDVVAGYGVDFTPSRMRLEELKRAVQLYHKRLNDELAAKRDLVRLSRAIEDLCTQHPEQASDLRIELAGIRELAADVLTRAGMVRELHERALVELAPDDVPFNLSCEGDIDVMPIINTTQESLLDSRNEQPRSNEREVLDTTGRSATELAYEKKPAGSGKPGTDKLNPIHKDADTIQGAVLGSVSVGLLHTACPEAQSMISVQFDSWTTLSRSGETMRRMIGLSEVGWADGKAKVGSYAAAAILATVLEKSLREPDQITRPGGYFRAMIDRALDGKLNLERSLFGLAGDRYSQR